MKNNKAIKKSVKSVKNMKPVKVVSFVYDKEDGEVDWRTIGVVESTRKYIKGIDSDKQFKTFLKSKIVGGKLIKGII